ncbi:hypothetical protein GWI33_013799 [Rhynchophorus ferrugineus]|uniref:Uncharacterized protein n=1 Tax=Rhynchophorus ferrugineus TaxID=354439 RepID=A0A834I5T3_RHYFE|nr:hypothetical protein GWI33_013799 [Rhynchophorus ferrugineus]
MARRSLRHPNPSTRATSRFGLFLAIRIVSRDNERQIKVSAAHNGRPFAAVLIRRLCKSARASPSPSPPPPLPSHSIKQSLRRSAARAR